MYPEYMEPLIVEKKLYRNNDGFLRLLFPAAWGIRHGDAVEVPMAWNLDSEALYTVEARILGRSEGGWEEADQE